MNAEELGKALAKHYKVKPESIVNFYTRGETVRGRIDFPTGRAQFVITFTELREAAAPAKAPRREKAEDDDS